MKKQKNGFTLAKLSAESGIANGYLTKVVKGECKLSEKALSKILPHLNLASPEQNYLKSLCTIADSESQESRIAAINHIQKLSGYQKLNPKETEVFKYLTHWYYVAIREMAQLPGFKLDAKWVQERLIHPVSTAEVQKALDFLVESGFLEVLPNGKVRPPEIKLDCLQNIYKVALNQYYRQLFSLAVEVSERVESHQKSITGFVFAIPEKKFAEIKTMLEKTLREIMKTSSEMKDAPDVVYHVNLMGFPLSKAPGEGSNA